MLGNGVYIYICINSMWLAMVWSFNTWDGRLGQSWTLDPSCWDWDMLPSGRSSRHGQFG